MTTTTFKDTVRCLLTLAAAFCASTVWAQDTESTPLAGSYDFLAVKNLSLKTTQVFDGDDAKDWTGEGFHAGIQTLSFTLYNCKEIPKDFIIPENPALIFEVKDMDGNVVSRQEKDLTQDFRKMKFSKNVSINMNMMLAVARGGEYQFTAEIAPELFSYDKAITLIDEQGVHITNKNTTVDRPLSPRLIITSGYPYNPSEIAGEKNIHWQLTSVKTPNEIIDQLDEVFELISDRPTLAAVDTLYMTVDNLQPGEYQYTITSEFAPANCTFISKVNDVLKPEISLDKSTYVFGEDKEAVVTVDMSYGYPYVGKGADSAKPTVLVRADLLNEQTSESYSDEAWADSDMHCTAVIKVPLEKVTEENLTENKGEIPLNITIFFNDMAQFDTTVKIPFEGEYSGITNIIVDNSGVGASDSESAANIIYDLSGRRVNHNNLVPGVYIKVSGATREKILIP